MTSPNKSIKNRAFLTYDPKKNNLFTLSEPDKVKIQFLQEYILQAAFISLKKKINEQVIERHHDQVKVKICISFFLFSFRLGLNSNKIYLFYFYYMIFIRKQKHKFYTQL